MLSTLTPGLFKKPPPIPFPFPFNFSSSETSIPTPYPHSPNPKTQRNLHAPPSSQNGKPTNPPPHHPLNRSQHPKLPRRTPRLAPHLPDAHRLGQTPRQSLQRPVPALRDPPHPLPRPAPAALRRGGPRAAGGVGEAVRVVRGAAAGGGEVLQADEEVGEAGGGQGEVAVEGVCVGGWWG